MKWTNATDAAAPTDAQVLILVLNPDNVEVQQSAEILYREFRHHGVSVLLDARPNRTNEPPAALKLTIGETLLTTGEVELTAKNTSRKAPLEDAVDVAVAWLREGKK